MAAILNADGAGTVNILHNNYSHNLPGSSGGPFAATGNLTVTTQSGNLGGYALNMINSSGDGNSLVNLSSGAFRGVSSNGISLSATTNGGSNTINLSSNIVSVDADGHGVFLIDHASGANTISNSGRVNAGGEGLYLSGNGTVTNAATGRIDAGANGIHMSGNGQITNNGDIRSDDRGIYFNGVGTATNTGNIVANSEGIHINSGLVGNTGNINGRTVAIHINGSGTATNSGELKGEYGIDITGAGRATNTGLITSIAFDGIHIGGLATGYNSGIINAMRDGVSINSGIFANAAGGQIDSGRTGMYIAATGTLTNAGEINAGSHGMHIAGSGSAYNDTTGKIYAGGNGVQITNGAFTNAGLIDAAGHGVQMTSGTVANTASGKIYANGDGINISAFGSISNQGLIGASGHGISITTGTVNNAGTINAGGNGINITNTGTVTNTGDVTSSNASGVYIGGNNSLVDNNGGSITGRTGVTIAGSSGTLLNRNNASIRSTHDDAVVMASGYVENNALIQGAARGIHVVGSGTIYNGAAGIIRSAAGDALLLGANSRVDNYNRISAIGGHGVNIIGNGQVTNNANAIIEAAGIGFNGVNILNSGAVDNYGTIYSADGQGVHIGYAAGDTGSIRNDGTITGGNGHGVDIYSGLVNNNTATSVIEAFGANHHGVNITTTGTVINRGSIQASGANGDGVRIGTDGRVYNNGGSITAINGNGVNIAGNALVQNVGANSSIEARGNNHHAVTIGGSGTVSNQGLVQANGVNGHGIRVGGYAEVYNEATGIIHALGANGDGVNIGSGYVENANRIEATHSGVVINGSGTAWNKTGAEILAGNGNGIEINDPAASTNLVKNDGNISLGVNNGSSGVKVTSLGGTIDILNTGKVTNVLGSGGHGIYATNTGAGAIHIEQTGPAAEIRTARAIGVFAQSANGKIEVLLAGGLLKTTDASGIIARSANGDIIIDTTGATVQINTIAANEHGIEGTSAGSGAVHITTGNPDTQITTISAGANGIRATSVTGTAVTVDMQGGSITTAGPNASGIHAAITGATATGTVAVNLAGSVTTTGNVSHGISATNAGAGDVVVTLQPTAKVTTDNGSAVHATTVEGDIYVLGPVATINATTHDNGLHALNAVSTGSGNIAVNMTGNYTTTGNAAHGWNLQTNGGNIIGLHNDGVIKTTGAISHAINAQTTLDGDIYLGLATTSTLATRDGSAFNATSANGDITITATTATIDANTVTNALAALNAAATGAGNIDVRAKGNYTTTGNASHGWNLTSNGGDIVGLHNDGAIKTTGAISHAINAATTGAGDIYLAIASTSTLGTRDGSAFNATTVNGDIVIDGRAGVIDANTVTDGLAALNAQAAGPGNINVWAQGNYTTAGIGSHGWNLTSAGGNIIGMNTGGTIATTATAAPGSHAINAATTLTGTIQLGWTEDTTITTKNGSAVNARAQNGDIIVSGTAGTVDANTITNGLHALNAIATGAGNIDIRATGDYTTAGNNANAWNLASNGGDIVALHNDGALTTTGTISHAISATTNGAGDIYAGWSPSTAINTTDGSAVNAYAQNGDITVAGTSGTVNANTKTNGLHALNAIATGAGNIDVQATGNYTTAGNNANAWNLASNGGDIHAFHNDGALTTTGTISHAISATTNGAGDIYVGWSPATTLRTTDGSAVNAYAQNGDILIDALVGTVDANTKTNGLAALNAIATGAGDIDVRAQGSYRTGGNAAHGWNLSSAGGNIHAANTGGLIATTGSDSHAIKAATTGAGTIDVNLSADTTITTKNGAAVYATGGNGHITINSAATVSATTTTAGLAALHAVNTGAGDVTVSAKGDYTATGASSHGWNLGSAGGSIIALDNGGSITTTGPVSHAINAYTTGTGAIAILPSAATTITTADGAAFHAAAQDGAIYIDGTAATINATTTTAGIAALYAVNTGTGAVDVRAHGNYKTTGAGSHGWELGSQGGSILAYNTGGTIATTATAGPGSNAINAATTGAGAIGVTLSNATVIATANGAAINATTANGNILVNGTAATINANTLTAGLHALNAVASGNGSVQVDARGNYATNGDNARGWNLGSATGSVAASMVSGTITTKGANADGIRAEVTAGAGNAYVNSAARIITTGNAAHGIVAKSAGGISTIINKGVVTTTGSAANGLVASCSIAVINVQANVSALGRDSSALVAGPSVSSTIAIASGVSALGGWGANASGATLNGTGVATGTHTVVNAGLLGALSERALIVNGATGLNLLNTGTMIGSVTGGAGNDTVVNTKLWIVRNHSAATGGGVRDTLGVSVTGFGAGTDTVINTGTIVLVGLSSGTTATLSSAGQYLPFGNSHYAVAVNGASQGHLLGLEEFVNTGVIDLVNGRTGDVLAIGGHAMLAGTNGNGRFVSDRGRINLDVLLNEGGASTRADILVVDRTHVSTGATILHVERAPGGLGALTIGNGIPVVEVLGGMTVSSTGAFALDRRILISPFEYRLYHGAKKGLPSTDGNWYLRSHYRPAVSSNLANWYEGATMFNHSHHERVSSDLMAASSTDGAATGNDRQNNGWLRTTGRMGLGDSAGGTHRTHTTNYTVQAGYDVLAAADLIMKGDVLRVGVMGAYGNSYTDVDLNDEEVRDNGNGRIDGLNFGIYGSWFADKAAKRGWYADSYLSISTFHNKTKDEGESEVRYKSRGFTASIEGGYAWHPKKTGFVFEPQAQLIYNHYSMDNHTDETGMVVTDRDSEYFRTRAGLRVYPQRKRFFQPFVEINWWHAFQDVELKFDTFRISSSTPRDIFGFKFGGQADLSKGWTVWGDAGFNLGSAHNYLDVRAMFGVRYGW